MRYRTLDKNNTYTLTHLLVCKKDISCRWSYKIKYRTDGTVERYKARLVVKGYTQTKGIDDTCFHIATLATVRAMLSLTTVNG